MKKIINIISKILLIINIIILIFIVSINIINSLRIIFLGITLGNNKYPNSIYWSEIHLKGIKGLIEYYTIHKNLITTIELPILLITITYIIIYIIIKKKTKR